MASTKHCDSSSAAGVDRLSALLERFRVHARLFRAGALCGISHFDDAPGRAWLHVLRRGAMTVTHPARRGVPRRIRLAGPALLFYPRPLAHDFHHAPDAGNDLVCATLDFDGGAAHPLARALPPVLALAVAELAGVDRTLELLFAETERVRCGQRLLADRLFEVLLLQLLRWLLDHPERSGVQAGLLAGLAQPKLARALTALHERPGHAWSLAAMAGEAGMSRSAFAAEFKAVIGITPGEYLLRWRISLAQAKLRAGTPVKAIGDALGYASAAAFSRAFAQAAGASPRAWLKQS